MLDTTSAVGNAKIYLETWDERRDSRLEPEYKSEFFPNERDRIEFLAGARLYGLLDTFETIHPQQLQVCDVICGPQRTFAVEMPRRTSKTTSIFLALLGRCLCRPNYLVTYTAQAGVAGSRQMGEWIDRLSTVNEDPDAGLPPWKRGTAKPKPRAAARQLALFGEEFEPDEPPAPADAVDAWDPWPFKRMLMGAVRTGIYFKNGSAIRHIPPKAANFRGAASDVSWIDEAQEIELDDGPALLAGIRPLQDTRPGSSVILSGTAGESRAGILWDALERGRAGDPAVGILDYCAPRGTEWSQVEDRATALDILESMHPGIGTLTTMDQMAAQYDDLPRPEWAREYLSLWPETYTARAIPADLWNRAKLEQRRPIPDRVAFGLAIKPGGETGAIVAAWRDAAGAAYLEVVAHQQGTRWIPKRCIELATKYRTTVAYDRRGEGAATRTEVERETSRRVLAEHGWPDITAGAIQLRRDLERGTVFHFGQVGLDTAVMYASRRDSGDAGMWTWTPMEAGRDIVCLDAASRALRNWDHTQDRRRRAGRPVIVTSD